MPLTSNIVTRFPNGVTNVPVGDIFNDLRMPDPTKYVTYFEDFHYYNASDWTVTETDSGATQALTGGNGGLILLTNTTADNDVNQIQKVVANFTATSGKKFFMKCRFKLNEVLQSEFAIGLQNVQSSNIDGCDLAKATDGVFFLKADGAATVNLYYRKDASTGSSVGSAIATLVDATYIELACFHDGVDRLYYAVDGTVSGYIDAGSAYQPNQDITPVISLKQGEATNAKTATVDYLFVAQER